MAGGICWDWERVQLPSQTRLSQARRHPPGMNCSLPLSRSGARPCIWPSEAYTLLRQDIYFAESHPASLFPSLSSRIIRYQSTICTILTSRQGKGRHHPPFTYRGAYSVLYCAYIHTYTPTYPIEVLYSTTALVLDLLFTIYPRAVTCPAHLAAYLHGIFLIQSPTTPGFVEGTAIGRHRGVSSVAVEE